MLVLLVNINQIQSSAFDNVSEFEWFKANKDKCVAGLCDGYCTKPVTDGNICPEDFLKDRNAILAVVISQHQSI